MEISRKLSSFSGEVFDKMYSEQLRIKGLVCDTATSFLIALFRTVNQVFQ